MKEYTRGTGEELHTQFTVLPQDHRYDIRIIRADWGEVVTVEAGGWLSGPVFKRQSLEKLEVGGVRGYQDPAGHQGGGGDEKVGVGQ